MINWPTPNGRVAKSDCPTPLLFELFIFFGQMAEFSLVLQGAGYLVTMAPPESYLDPGMGSG